MYTYLDIDFEFGNACMRYVGGNFDSKREGEFGSHVRHVASLMIIMIVKCIIIVYR